MEFFIAINGSQQGPFPIDQLLARGLRPDTLVWRAGMPQWQRADSISELAPLFASSPSQPPPYSAPPFGAYATTPPVQSTFADKDKRIIAGICALVGGSFGIHKFFLGMPGPGLAMLLVTLLTHFWGGPIMHAIGIVEGIIYLTKSDAEFHRIYVVGKKHWF